LSEKSGLQTLTKIVSDGADVVSSGTVFRTHRPETEKTLLPTVESHLTTQQAVSCGLMDFICDQTSDATH